MFSKFYSASQGLFRFILVSSLLIISLKQHADGLIITSVIAGNKKFKTVSFDHKFLKPLMFEKDLPSTEFRRHRTVRPPKFDIDVNIPIKLPLEEEYPQEEYKKPVESNIFFQSGDIYEPNYGKSKKQFYSSSGGKKPQSGGDEYAAASDQQEQVNDAMTPSNLVSEGLKGLLPALAKSIKFQPQIETVSQIQAASRRSNAPADIKDARVMTPVMTQRQHFVQPVRYKPQQQTMSQQQPQVDQVQLRTDDLTPSASGSYQQQQHKSYDKEPDFVPGGFVNLQLSGPSGGPQITYEDYDREKWAQQLSQAEGAMPYPILNYQQLQNFYGGLGTFTNGVAEHRYVEHSLLEKLKSSISHVTSKFHIG